MQAVARYLQPGAGSTESGFPFKAVNAASSWAEITGFELSLEEVDLLLTRGQLKVRL
jgi:hypothetical protein